MPSLFAEGVVKLQHINFGETQFSPGVFLKLARSLKFLSFEGVWKYSEIWGDTPTSAIGKVH